MVVLGQIRQAQQQVQVDSLEQRPRHLKNRAQEIQLSLKNT